MTKSMTKTTKEGKPSSEGEVVEHFRELGLEAEEAMKFWDWYEQTGWKLKGGNPIVDWKATARTWKRRTLTQKNEKRGFNKDNFDSNALEQFIAKGS
tara:strand:+ start:138 stop:428 length:291 start_codon:yes stop_codon:yes gene_type:complete